MNPVLVDSHGRIIDYLRVSITDLCNLRCVYCRPPEGVKLVTHAEILRYEEILRIVEIARDLGIRKLRVTGGEPLVRRGAVEFIARLTALQGIEDVGLTTNGTLLPEVAERLRDAGLKRINISIDSLRKDVFREITGYDGLDDVLRGIQAAIEVELSPVKLNVVLLEGINEPDITNFARMTLDKPVDVRFIERMPFGAEDPDGAPPSFSAAAARSMIEQEVGKLIPVERNGMDGPASMYRIEGAAGRIGMIDPITGHFCATCNRLRLTARGTLRPCLLGRGEFDIKTPLRNGASREELVDCIRVAVNAKPVGSLGHGSSLGDGMNMIGG